MWIVTWGMMCWEGRTAVIAGEFEQWTFVEIISVRHANLLYFDFSLDRVYDIVKSCNELLYTVFWNEEAAFPLKNVTIQDIAITKTIHNTYGTFLSSNWTLSKSSKSFHIIYPKNNSVLYTNEWNIQPYANVTLSFPERRGFHNELHIRCDCSSLYLFLPQGVYVDMDELATLTDWNFQAVPSIVDTELSFHKSSAIILHISDKSMNSQKPKLNIHLPIHLRYILSVDADSTHQRSIFIPPPFMRIDSHILLTNLSAIHLSVPSGNEADAHFVFPVTFLILVLSTLFLLVKIVKYHTSCSC